MAVKREFINKSQKRQLASVKKKVSLYTEDTPSDKMPKYRKTTNKIIFNENSVRSADGGVNSGITVNENYGGAIDIYINTKSVGSYKELFGLSRHEARHAYLFDKNVPSIFHHWIFNQNGYDKR